MDRCATWVELFSEAMVGKTFNVLWDVPPSYLRLGSHEVDVWRIRLDQPDPEVRRLLRTLTPDESDRAARFHYERDRNHFVVARGQLRYILGRYLEMEPAKLRFRYSSYGKPSLSSELTDVALRFNLSHSHGWALLAVAIGREVGVDIEHVRPEVAGERIAERFFSIREIKVLRALPVHLQAEAFFNCWTRKEAYIKARGEGLSFPLDKFDVSLVPGEPAALLRTRGDALEAERWALRDLESSTGYAAAIAVEGHMWQLRCWQGP